MTEFLWIPGHGIDPAALERLRSHFPKPQQPMGEAWFMSEERRLFTELMADLDSLSAFDLQEPLEEIASGFSCFGPEKEWVDWYHYLLGALLPRAHESFVHSLVEFLITGFIAAHPADANFIGYDEFRTDALLTLGRCMMEPDCWNGSDISVGRILRRSNDNPNKVWIWWEASGDLSGSLFFCLKYLPEEEVEPWLRSVLEIPVTPLARPTNSVGRQRIRHSQW